MYSTKNRLTLYSINRLTLYSIATFQSKPSDFVLGPEFSFWQNSPFILLVTFEAFQHFMGVHFPLWVKMSGLTSYDLPFKKVLTKSAQRLHFYLDFSKIRQIHKEVSRYVLQYCVNLFVCLFVSMDAFL